MLDAMCVRGGRLTVYQHECRLWVAQMSVVCEGQRYDACGASTSEQGAVIRLAWDLEEQDWPI